MSWCYVSRMKTALYRPLADGRDGRTGDLEKSRFMAGLEEMPEKLEWKDPVWSHCEQVRGVWQNERISSVLSLTGSVSNAKDLLACGDDTGLIRLFTYPCTQQQVTI